MGKALPKTLGRYQIVKHLANGGMAQVLLARATGIEGFSRHVVVKQIHSERAADPLFVKMFLDEARLAAALHHHNIVQVHDIGQEDGEYFFAMEYVHGEDLRKLLMNVNKLKQKVPFEHVIAIVTAAAAALHYAHDMKGPDRKPLGLVHRDVSPANILVGYDGNVKVVDFGIAKAARSTETQAGTLKGKVAYMAPEQCAGKAVDRRSDVYALGIVLYELTTVRRLFKGDNDFLTMSAIVQGNIPKPSANRKDIPPELEEIILKALALSPADRFQTANEMRISLDKFALKAGIRTSTSGLADYMTSVFGERPEPWLSDDEEIEVEHGVDFDGSASGMASPSSDAVANLAIPETLEPTPSAPIVRARKKAITENPDPGATVKGMLRAPPSPAEPAAALKQPARPVPPPRPTPPPRSTPTSPRRNMPATTPLEPGGALAASTIGTEFPKPPILPSTSAVETTEWGATETPSATPFSFPAGTEATEPSAPEAARKKWIPIVAGVGGLGLVVILLLAFTGGSESTPAAPAAKPPIVAPASTPDAASAVAAQPPDAPPVEEVAPDAAVAIQPVDASTDVVEMGSGTGSSVSADGSGAGSGSAVKKKRKPKATWNPDELFLK